MESHKYKCNFCGKILSRSDTFKNHLSICKIKKKTESNEDKTIEDKNKIINQKNNIIYEKDKIIYEKDKIINKIFNEINSIFNEKDLKINELEERIKQQDLIIDKLLNKSKSKTINNINNGNINNINNNITISFGNEDVKNLLSNKEKHDIIGSKHMCLEKLINHIHFNDNYKQYNNILITNMKDNLAYIYDAINRQFMAVNKDDFMEDLLNLRMADITTIYNELIDKNEIDTKTMKIIELLQDKIENNDEYKESKKNALKLFVYNKSKSISK